MSHTPGPWHTDGAEVYAEGLEWVAEALNDKLPDGGEANAILIAAAPDLLVACRRLAERFLSVDPEGCVYDPTWLTACKIIAKAEGHAQ